MIEARPLFFIGRVWAGSSQPLRRGRLKKYDDALSETVLQRFFTCVSFYFPFTAMNFGMGLTKVRFGDYFFGTGLGIIVAPLYSLFLSAR